MGAAPSLELPSRQRPVSWAERVLMDQGMPGEELEVLMLADDAEMVRRHLELHLERLEEWFTGQRRRATSARRILIDAVSSRGRLD